MLEEQTLKELWCDLTRGHSFYYVRIKHNEYEARCSECTFVDKKYYYVDGYTKRYKGHGLGGGR